MQFFLTLVFLFNHPLPANQCKKFVAHGQFVKRGQQVFFVTHVNSQKEKMWPVNVKDAFEEVEFRSRQNQLAKVTGSFDGKRLVVKSFELSTDALEKSFSDEAIEFGENQSCR